MRVKLLLQLEGYGVTIAKGLLLILRCWPLGKPSSLNICSHTREQVYWTQQIRQARLHEACYPPGMSTQNELLFPAHAIIIYKAQFAIMTLFTLFTVFIDNIYRPYSYQIEQVILPSARSASSMPRIIVEHIACKCPNFAAPSMPMDMFPHYFVPPHHFTEVPTTHGAGVCFHHRISACCLRV